jgi:hypothetical protein
LKGEGGCNLLLLVTGCLLLVSGYWLLVAGCLLLVAGCLLIFAGYYISSDFKDYYFCFGVGSH